MVKRKVLYGLPVAALAVGAGLFVPTGAWADGACPEVDESKVVATFDGCRYDGLDAVFDAINNDAGSGVHHVVALETDTIAGGYSMKSGVNFELDLNGKTLQMGTTLVGSTGTKSQGWQLLKDSDIEFKNGKIIAASTAKMLVQNYANLTLRNIELDGTTMTASGVYTLSNNNGLTQILGDTTIKANDGSYAFDACWAPNKGYPDGAQVVVDTAGTIAGTVQVDLWGTMQTSGDILTTLTIKNGTFTRPFDVDNRLASVVTIEGGVFATEPSEEEIVDGMEPEQNEETGAWEILPVETNMIDNGAMESDGTKAGALAGDAMFTQGFVTDRKAYFELATLDDNEFEALVLDETKGGDLVLGFDASLYDRNGATVDVNDTSITVRVALTEAQYNTLSSYDKVEIVYFDDNGAEQERLAGELLAESDASTGEVKYFLVFTTSHLSTYAAVGVNTTEEAEEAAAATTPDTGTVTAAGASAAAASILTAAAVGVIVAIVGFAVLVRRK